MRFYPMLKFCSNERTAKYLNGGDVFPINIEFSISGVCPANCRKCFYRVNNNELGGMDGKFFNFKRMKSLIEEFRDVGVKSITWTGGGEPTNHPRFKEISQLVSDSGIEQGLFTNALLPIKYEPALMQWIRVTKTNHPFPEENILNLRPCRTVGLCINYSVGDERFIDDGIRIAERLEEMKTGSDQSSYLQIRPEMNTLGAIHECNLPKINHKLVVMTEKTAVSEGEREYRDCEGYHFTPFIWQTGKVSVCAYHYGKKEFELGDLYSQSFKEIMTKAPRSVKVIPSCQACCKLHEMNKMIDEYKLLEDKNFI